MAIEYFGNWFGDASGTGGAGATIAEGLTSGDIAQIRGIAEGLLPDTCTIEYRALTDDSHGGQTVAYTERATAVECRIAPRAANVGVWADREGQQGSHILTLPHDQAIDYDDRITITGESDPYYIIGIEQWTGSWKSCQRVAISRSELI